MQRHAVHENEIARMQRHQLIANEIVALTFLKVIDFVKGM